MDKIFKILLVDPISIVNLTKEEIDEEFTDELYRYIQTEDIVNNKIAVVSEDTFYIRGDMKKINELDKFISKYHIIEVTDVSNDLLVSNDIYNSINELDMDQFGQMFDDFRLLYTTKDNVLDKILKRGMDYIDDIDRQILED